MTVSLSSYQKGQVPLMNIAERTGARLKIIWLRADPSVISDEEITRMIKERAAKQGDYAGTLGTIHDTTFFRERHKIFEPIKVPGSICIETWPKNSRETTLVRALEYVRDPNTGYVADR